MRRIIKILGWVAGMIFFLLLLVFLLPHIPVVQDKLIRVAEDYYQKKTGEDISIGKIYFWPDGTIVIRQVNIPDQTGSTFVNAGQVRADISVRALLKGDFVLTNAEVEEGGVVIERREDGSFNFSFIIEAFTTNNMSGGSSGSFRLENVFLENSTFSFSDRRSKFYTKADVRLLKTSFTRFDPDEQVFHMSTIDIVGGDGYVMDLSSGSEEVNDTTESRMPDVFFSAVNLYDSRYLVYMREDALVVSSYAGELHATTKEFDLERSIMHFKNIEMRNSGSAIRQGIVLQDTSEVSDTSGNNAQWIIIADKINFSNSWFTYDDEKEPVQAKGFHPSHIRFTHVNITARSVLSAGSNTKAVINSGSLISFDNYRLKSISGEFHVSEKSIGARSFHIVTSASNISGDFITRQKSFNSFSDDLAGVRYYVNFAPSKVGVRDILYFSHRLDTVPMINRNYDLQVGLHGNAQGTLKQMSLNRFSTVVYGSSAIVTGKLMNLDSTSALAYDLSFEKVKILSSSVRKLVPDTLISDKLNMPDHIHMTGTAAGNMTAHNFDLKITSSDGAIVTQGTAGRKGIDIIAQLDTLNIGKIIGAEKNIGVLSGNITASLSSFNPDSATGTITTALSSVEIKNKNYTGVSADLKIDKGNLTGAASVDDAFAKFSAKGSGSYKNKVLDASVVADIDTLDLYAMGITSDTLSLKGHTELSFNGRNADDFEANGKASKLIVKKDRYNIHPDSLMFSVSSKSNKISLDINSSLADIEINGTGKLSTLPADLGNYFQSYYGNSVRRQDSIDVDHQLSFSVNIKDPSEVIPLIDPTLTVSPFTISGDFNGSTNDLTANSKINYLNLRGNTIDSIKVEIKGDAEKLAGTISAPHVVSKGMMFPNPSVSVIIKNDSLQYVASVTGNDKVQRLKLGGIIQRLEDGFAFSVKPGEFVLNNKSWDVMPGNRLTFDSTGMSVKDFRITHGDQLLTIDEKTEDRLTITANDFDLMDISMIADSNRYVTGGRLSGEVTLPRNAELADLSGRLTIKDFNFRKDTMGDVGLTLANKGGSKLGVEATVTGRGNSIKMDGAYDFADSFTPFDFKMNITQVSFETLKPYLGPVFEKMHGYAKADLTLRGNTEYPLFDGDILIADASLLPKYTHSWVKIKDQPIHADQSSFQFTNFLMTDSLNNPALLNGYICPEGLPHITFDLLLVTSNFLFLNTREGDNEQYFGRAYATSISHLTGDDVNPVVDIDAKLEKGSRLTLLVPEQKLRESNANDVVQFIDLQADSVRNQIKKKREEPSFAGVTLTSNIEVDENSEFKLLIDPLAGDSLSVKGKTTFSFSVDPGGKMSMAGVYEVTEGSYLLTLTKGLKRRFDIARGSKITWSGNPINPDLDVSASYTVRAAPYELIVDDVTAFTENTAGSYRQEMPFIVNLKMAGALARPGVSFNVQLPNDQQGALEGTVYARLNQLNQNASELNTQVFSLLVLNRFFNNQEVLNSGGPLLSSYARTGLSRIISQRLNSFATTYAKFVELQLDVDFYETYNGSTIENSTHMRIGVGRKLFADRLDLRTGGQVMLQGTSQFNNNDFPSMITAEYKLTRDGRYRITGFRKNTYEGVFEGQIIREGAGIVFIRDFNKFGEIFKRPEEHDLLDAAPKPRQ